jgi:hypothetical protein
MHGCALHRLGMLILGQDVRGHAGCKLQNEGESCCRSSSKSIHLPHNNGP